MSRAGADVSSGHVRSGKTTAVEGFEPLPNYVNQILEGGGLRGGGGR